MRRGHLARSLLGLVAVVGLLLPGIATAASPRIAEAGNAGFPDRAYVLTMPGTRPLDASSVHVFENGNPIQDVTVVPPQAASKGGFGVVLVVDTSLSMQGKPITAAVAAARAFADQRTPNEALGFLTFNQGVRIALAPTTDAKAISAALASTPRLAFGTHIFDAADRAIGLLRQAKVTVGSVILLSDGANTGRRLQPLRGAPERGLPADPLATLEAHAHAAHVRIFTVGLSSSEFRPATLRAVARGTGAAYAEASSPAALKQIYRALSQRLGHEYLLQYRSLAGPAVRVRVRIEVAGVPSAALAAYRTPALPVGSLRPFHRSPFDRFWASPAAPGVVSLCVGLLVVLVMLRVIRSRRSSLRVRMASFVSIRQRAKVQEETMQRLSQGLAAVERALARTSWWGGFKEELEIAEVATPPAQIVVGTAVATVILGVLLGLLFPVLALLALSVPFGVRSTLKRKLAVRRGRFAEQLPDSMTILASALRAGHNFIGALTVMVDECDEPARSEFKRALADERLAVPVEDTLVKVAGRMASGDLEQIALVAALQRQTGGNTAEVLDTVVDTIRERSELRRIVNTLTAQGRLSRWILTALPVVLCLMIAAVNRAYISPLFTTAKGQVLLGLAIAMVTAGSLVIKRVIEIEV
jgi:tight adherence protein B